MPNKTIEIPDDCVVILVSKFTRHTKVFVGDKQIPLVQSINFEAHASEVVPKLDIAFSEIYPHGTYFMPEGDKTADEVRETIKSFKDLILKAVPHADVTNKQAQIVGEDHGGIPND